MIATQYLPAHDVHLDSGPDFVELRRLELLPVFAHLQLEKNSKVEWDGIIGSSTSSASLNSVCAK